MKLHHASAALLVLVFLAAAAHAGENASRTEKYDLAPGNSATSSRIACTSTFEFETTVFETDGTKSTENFSIVETSDFSETRATDAENNTVITRKYHTLENTLRKNAGPERTVPYALNGKTVEITENKNGKTEVACTTAKLAEHDKNLALQTANCPALLPSEPVAAGDTWNSSDTSLRFFLVRAKRRFVKNINAKMKLKTVTEKDGKKTAVIEVQLTAVIKAGKTTFNFTLNGAITVDVESRAVLSLNLAGPVKANTPPLSSGKKIIHKGKYAVSITAAPGEDAPDEKKTESEEKSEE